MYVCCMCSMCICMCIVCVYVHILCWIIFINFCACVHYCVHVRVDFFILKEDDDDIGHLYWYNMLTYYICLLIYIYGHFFFVFFIFVVVCAFICLYVCLCLCVFVCVCLCHRVLHMYICVQCGVCIHNLYVYAHTHGTK